MKKTPIFKHIINHSFCSFFLPLWLLAGTILVLGGCAGTDPHPEQSLSHAAMAFPEVNFSWHPLMQVDYKNDHEEVRNAVFEVLEQLGERIEDMDSESCMTASREYSTLIPSPDNQADSAEYQIIIQLTSPGDNITGVSMEVLLSPKNSTRAGVIRQLFFHQLNSSLLPQLFTFQDNDRIYTVPADEMMPTETVQYAVQNNDSLSSIAAKYTTSVNNYQQIAAFNNIQENRLRIGQILRIPKQILKEKYQENGIPEPVVTSTAAVKKQDKALPPDCGANNEDCFIHQVAADENLSLVAKRVTGDANNWQAIARVNHLDNPGTLAPGDSIFIPNGLLKEKMAHQEDTADRENTSNADDATDQKSKENEANTTTENKTGIENQPISFITVYSHPREVMHQAILEVFAEFAITSLVSEADKITSTAWKHDNIIYSFSISLLDKENSTELNFNCAVTAESSTGATVFWDNKSADNDQQAIDNDQQLADNDQLAIDNDQQLADNDQLATDITSDMNARGQQWIEESFFPALDKAINGLAGD